MQREVMPDVVLLRAVIGAPVVEVRVRTGVIAQAAARIADVRQELGKSVGGANAEPLRISLLKPQQARVVIGHADRRRNDGHLVELRKGPVSLRLTGRAEHLRGDLIQRQIGIRQLERAVAERRHLDGGAPRQLTLQSEIKLLRVAGRPAGLVIRNGRARGRPLRGDDRQNSLLLPLRDAARSN